MSRKVLNVRTHVGGLHGKTSYDAEKDKAEMIEGEKGIEVLSINGKPLINKEGLPYILVIDYPNCTEHCVLAEEKRGPGRPPGPKVA